MSAQKEDLSKLRNEIDKIDDQLITLLKDRLEIVKQVGQHKSKNSLSRSFIRSGREAEMVRNLSKKAQNTMPVAAIATMWRMIISSSLNTEQNIKLLSYSNDNKNDCYWHAREYYGVFVDIQCKPSKEDIIKEIASGKANVGMLPLVDDSKNPWWNRPIEEKNEIYVFACAPFIETKYDKSSPSLVIANVLPEQTEDDVSVVVINSNKCAEEIISNLNQMDVFTKVIATTDGAYLVEVDKFIAINDNKIQNIKNITNAESVRLLGSYATPIKADNL